MRTFLNPSRVFVIVAAVIVGSTALTYKNGQTVLRARDKIAAETEAIRTIDNLLLNLREAETGQRGYLLTGDEKYLLPYHAGISQLPKQLGKLEAAPIPESQKQTVALIRPLTEEKLAELQQTIEVRRSGDVKAALSMVKTGTGKGVMDKIRVLTGALKSRQVALHNEAVESANRATSIRTITFVFTGLMNLLFLAWAFRLVTREIGDHANARAEAERQRETATHKGETLRVTLASIGDCVIVTDTEGRITFMNATAEALTGWKFADALSLPAAQVFRIVHELTREPIASPVEKVLENGVIIGLANHTILIRKDGSEVPIDDSGAPIRTSKGDILGVVLVFRDFSTYKKAANELRKAKEAAEAANQTKDHFLAMLSHELRTPLTPVLATLNVWGLTCEMPDVLVPDVQMMRRNVELECRLIDDLLDLTRISKGMLSLQPEFTNVHELIELVVGMFEEPVRTDELRISLNLKASRPYVYADPARFQQVVWNVVKNARKFTGKGGEIRISTEDGPDGNLQVVVADTGIGMSEETLSRLFHPFEQGKRARNRGGLGLGLSISKALLETMGGSISATSGGVDKGSTFKLNFPSSEPILQSAKPVKTGSNGKSVQSRKLKILLVEDHLDTALAMKRLLELRGHELHLAHSVAEAFTRIAQEEFELLLCDLGLPDGSGLDVIRHYRKGNRTPAIVVSGFGMESDIANCLQAGFDAHVTKPINLQHLEAMILKFTDGGLVAAR